VFSGMDGAVPREVGLVEESLMFSQELRVWPYTEKPEPRLATVGPQEGAQRPWWRKVFGG
jgi:hypothetical protein